MNPGRYADRVENEPVPTGEIGDPPEHFRHAKKKIWREIVANSPPGVLKNSDRMTVELAAHLMDKLRNDEEGILKASEYTLLLNVLAKLGMNPIDRTRIAATPPDKKEKAADPWAELLQQ